jgi:hypothetical protein
LGGFIHGEWRPGGGALLISSLERLLFGLKKEEKNTKSCAVRIINIWWKFNLAKQGS